MSQYWDKFQRDRISRRKMLGWSGAAVGVTSLAIVGCTASTAEPTAVAAVPTKPVTGSGSTPAAVAATATPAAPAAKYGGIIRSEWHTSTTPDLDPHFTTNNDLHLYGSAVGMSRLLKFKNGPSSDLKAFVPEGDLAESWTQTDPLTYVFKLRQGVKWQNVAPVNGRELVADDLVWSYQRTIDGKVNASYINNIAKFTAVDKYTLRLDLKENDADFLVSLSFGNLKIAAHEVADANGDLKKGPVIGTGPWIWESWDQATGLHTLKRNPDYFIKGLPYADGLVFQSVKDTSTVLPAFRTKNIDIEGASPVIDKKLKESLDKEIPGLQASSGIANGANLEIGVFTGNAPLSDKRVRQALSKAIDRQEILDTVFFGLGSWLPGIQLPGADYWLPDAELKTILKYDPEGAKKLLADAGFASGLNIEVSFPNYGATYQDSVELISAQWKKVGINATIRQIETLQYTGNILTGQGPFQAYFAPAVSIPTANAALTSKFKTGGGRNVYKYSDPKLDALIDQQFSMSKDPEGRKKILQDIQRITLDAAAVIPIIYGGGYTVWHPYVKNYAKGVSWGFGNEYDHMTRVWLDK